MFKSIKSSILFFCVALVLLHGLPNDLFAQRGDRGQDRSQDRGRGRGGSFDVATILNRIDSNGNQILEPSEMRGRTQQMVRDVGLDPNRPHAISVITKLLQDKENPDANGTSPNGTPNGDQDVVRNVPGFGVDVEPAGIRDFSPTGEERMPPEAMKNKFGDNVMAQVEGTLNRYDTSKNGILEPNEIQRSRWQNPSSEESDTNKDGNLTRLELAYRYKNREDDVKKRMEESRARRTSANPNTMTVGNPVSANIRIVQPGNQSAGRSNSPYPTTPASAPASASGNNRGFNSGSDAYVRYAEGLLKTYDRDNDGRLSEQELKEMRRPPKDADTNRDKFVDKAELIASISNRSDTTATAVENQSAIHSGRVTPSEQVSDKRRPATATYNQADSIFGGKDLNNDRQLQMSEFAQEWDDETVKEFESKDRNGDGVITEKEWLGK